MNTLQTFLFPNLDMRVDEDMYVRVNDRCWAEFGRRALCFEEGGLAFTDTFYNSLSVGVWKRRCQVSRLALRLEGQGDFVLSLGLHRPAQGFTWVDQRRVSLAGHGDAADAWPIAAWPDLSDGLLFFRLRALGRGELTGGAYVTPDAPRHEVRLGLVITHFNRVAQVQPAIRRIRRELLDRPDLAGRITLTVVDNSRNLAIEPHPGIEHIPNRNLGGTGGFMRGLISLIDGGRHTHALFMDDDASCEADSLARCLALLQYAKDARLAVAGALLREVAAWEVLEKGARFDGAVRPQKRGLDMRRVADLMEAEREDARPDYGAWWLFAFPLAEVRTWPFPFFVRGDDIHFGLCNRFDIATVNGVACLGEDFSAKQGPMTAYLDARYHMVLGLMSPRGGTAAVVWVGCRLFTKSMTSYLYGSAHAVTLAIRHTLAGPGFFRDNLDLAAVRAQIAGFAAGEKLAPIDREGLALRPARTRRESRWRRLARVLTLHGFLLPDFLIRNRTTLQPKGFHGKASAVFRYRRVLYEHAASGEGFIAMYDRGRFFAELRGFLVAWFTLLAQVPRLREAYRRGADEMASEAFWRDVYADDLRPSPAAARAPTAAGVAARGAELLHDHPDEIRHVRTPLA